MKRSLFATICMITSLWTFAQPTPFSCSGSDGFGYYISSSTENNGATNLTYRSSNLSKIETTTGTITSVCSSAIIGVSLNGLAFNPHDNYLYAVSRYDATQFSGKLFRIGSNCQKVELPVTGSIIKFNNNRKADIDAAGGNIGSGTFDLDNNYYVNTSFTNSGSSGFTNKIQKIRITESGATVVSTKTLTCTTGTCSGKVQITDIIYDEASGKLIGSNFINKRLYSIDASTGIMTPFAAQTTGLNSAVLGLYKNRTGEIRAITALGEVYNVNAATGAFTLISTVTGLISKNADAASGCYAPPSISGNLFYDTNRLTDNTVNGTGTQNAGTTKMFANLVQGGLIDKSSEILQDGSYQFLGLFSGTYEVQISAIQGIIGATAPAQNLPSEYKWVGDNIGASAGSDGDPNGRITVTVINVIDVIDVNFGIDEVDIVLPVDFVSFEGYTIGENARLAWMTANEINNDYFEIEKQSQGGEFKSIGKVKSEKLNVYQFMDRNFHANSTYRLKQVDLNGLFHYSKKIIVQKNRSFDIALFPSIIEDGFKVMINTNQEDKALNLMIYDSSGRLIRTYALLDGENEFSASGLPNGILMVQAIDRKGAIILQAKMVKI